MCKFLIVLLDRLVTIFPCQELLMQHNVWFRFSWLQKYYQTFLMKTVLSLILFPKCLAKPRDNENKPRLRTRSLQREESAHLDVETSRCVISDFIWCVCCLLVNFPFLSPKVYKRQRQLFTFSCTLRGKVLKTGQINKR